MGVICLCLLDSSGLVWKNNKPKMHTRPNIEYSHRSLGKPIRHFNLLNDGVSFLYMMIKYTSLLLTFDTFFHRVQSYCAVPFKAT